MKFKIVLVSLSVIAIVLHVIVYFHLISKLVVEAYKLSKILFGFSTVQEENLLTYLQLSMLALLSIATLVLLSLCAGILYGCSRLLKVQVRYRDAVVIAGLGFYPCVITHMLTYWSNGEDVIKTVLTLLDPSYQAMSFIVLPVACATPVLKMLSETTYKRALVVSSLTYVITYLLTFTVPKYLIYLLTGHVTQELIQ